jgi:hypothetical protein
MSFTIQDLAGDQPAQNQPQSKPTAPASAPSQKPGSFTPADFQDETSKHPDTAGKPQFAPYNAAAFGRYTTPEDYEAWASVHPKIGPDSKPGEYEAWTSANTPGGYKETLKNAAETTGDAALAFGTAMGVTAIPEVLPSVLIHTVEGVKALGAWAEAHPYKAFMLYQVAKELLPGAKKAMGLVKAAPTGE